MRHEKGQWEARWWKVFELNGKMNLWDYTKIVLVDFKGSFHSQYLERYNVNEIIKRLINFLKLNFSTILAMTWLRRSLRSSWTSPRRAEGSTDQSSLQTSMVGPLLTVHHLQQIIWPTSGHIMEEVRSDPELQSQYIPRNPVSRVIQCAAVASENEVGL